MSKPGLPTSTSSSDSPERSTNHGKLWLVALLLSGLIMAVAYAFFAQFEHESWFPDELAGFLNWHELEVFLGGGLILCVLLAMLFYRFNAFSSPVEQLSGWASGSDLDVKPARAPAPIARSAIQEEQWPTLEVLMQRDRRACFGDLVLTDRRLFFVCYRDESLTKAVGGQALAAQFGILGVLIQALLSKPGQRRRDREGEQARREMQGLSLEARAARNPYGLNLTPQEITRLVKSWSGSWLEVGTDKYRFLRIDKADLLVVKNWCSMNGVAVKGF